MAGTNLHTEDGHEWHDAREEEFATVPSWALSSPNPLNELRQRKNHDASDKSVPLTPATPETSSTWSSWLSSSSPTQSSAVKRDWLIEARRRLGGFETFFRTTVPYGLGCIYYIVDFEGPPDTDLLAEAMRFQVKQHPNLRSRLHGDYLEAVAFEDCPQIVVPYIESEDVVGYTERAMKAAKELKAGRDPYLWQLALHHTPSSESHHLLFLIHHAISDGDSILRCLQSLMEGMASLSPLSPHERERKLAQVKALPQLASADEQLYPLYNGYYLVYHFRTLFREVWRVVLRPRLPRPCQMTLTEAPRVTRCLSFVLDAPDFKRLLKTCKANQTSVTGALVAATSQAMEGFIEGPPSSFKMKVEVLVNFRGKASATLGSKDSHQLYAAPMDMLLPAGNKAETRLEFWRTAREAKREIDAFATEPHRIVDTLEFFYIMGHHPIAMPLIRLFGASPRQGRQKALSISNLGSTDKLFQPAGPWRLGRMQMGIDELLFGHSVFLAMASHEGRLNFSLSYIEPIVSKAMAENYSQAVIRALIDACPPASEDAPPTPQTPVSITAKPSISVPSAQPSTPSTLRRGLREGERLVSGAGRTGMGGIVSPIGGGTASATGGGGGGGLVSGGGAGEVGVASPAAGGGASSSLSSGSSNVHRMAAGS
ncbi:hypothetical protein NSK_005059 [Nannochloropsis salina CCMP1776]|uniref:Condensation domain-containing protein n=1 Tax=Nannochloropsis salina CCMP1776 TaxID=1027361 RepID=A0A4D9CZG7_9STRA|nr:hypothetical protein NSK_005059 [Nannochloropsis salina CCMP1776]|eukprot:TFJ83964.1 hypothetical protein NSK_005059 [Nannochloropsis salina CCMP1776]